MKILMIPVFVTMYLTVSGEIHRKYISYIRKEINSYSVYTFTKEYEVERYQVAGLLQVGR